eukprot:7456041-Lingulodinium_polyedra.AAC.1
MAFPPCCVGAHLWPHPQGQARFQGRCTLPRHLPGLGPAQEVFSFRLGSWPLCQVHGFAEGFQLRSNFVGVRVAQLKGCFS